MSKTPSTMIALNTPAPDFYLSDAISNQKIKLSDYQKDAKGTLVMFICNHCPFVKHLMEGMIDLANDYEGKSLKIIAINSNNNPDYPEDSFENMQLTAATAKINFPYLFDETQEVARAYQAACTPDFFLFDASNKLVYRGQFDDSRPGNLVAVTGQDLRHAIDCLLADKENKKEQKPSLGCNIKWID